MTTFTTKLFVIIVIISIFHDLYLISKLSLLVVFVFVMFSCIYFEFINAVNLKIRNGMNQSNRQIKLHEIRLIN